LEEPRQEILSVTNLRKVYGDTVAVDGVSFAVRRNEIVGLLGPNGAGKTTTINMVLGVLDPTEGTILVDGVNIARRRSQALQRTNFAAVYAPVPGNLTVIQNLRIFAMLYGVKHLTPRIEWTLLIGGGLAVFDLLLACWFFSRTYRYAVRGGLIARYSAETVS